MEMYEKKQLLKQSDTIEVHLVTDKTTSKEYIMKTSNRVIKGILPKNHTNIVNCVTHSEDSHTIIMEYYQGKV